MLLTTDVLQLYSKERYGYSAEEEVSSEEWGIRKEIKYYQYLERKTGIYLCVNDIFTE